MPTYLCMHAATPLCICMQLFYAPHSSMHPDSSMHVRLLCDTYATPVRPLHVRFLLCNSCAIPMRLHSCAIPVRLQPCNSSYATPMRLLCNSYATSMQLLCDSCATPVRLLAMRLHICHLYGIISIHPCTPPTHPSVPTIHATQRKRSSTSTQRQRGARLTGYLGRGWGCHHPEENHRRTR